MAETISALQFRLPNARAGQAYQAPFKILGPDAGGGLQIRLLAVPPQLGLSFDASSQLMQGVPAQAGEYELPLEWSRDGSQWHGGKCPLIVIADPRSLWKVLEPPADAPYPKAHGAQQMFATGQLAGPGTAGQGAAGRAADQPGNGSADAAPPAPVTSGSRIWTLLAASRRGRSHEHAGAFRDDDFFLAHEAGNGWSVMLVADGAGSASSSREGSRLAVRTAGRYLQQALAGETGQRCCALLAQADAADAADAVGEAALHEAFRQLLQHAATLAVDAIEIEAAQRQLIARDYATTLLACCVLPLGAKTFVASFWIGDGGIAVYGPRGQVSLLGTPDSGEFAGQTRFLDRACLASAGFASRISTGHYADVSGVLLMTDGVSDPRFETDNGLKNPVKWDALWDELAPCLAAADPAQQVYDWLHFFTPGHHDDRTLALMWPAAGEAP